MALCFFEIFKSHKLIMTKLGIIIQKNITFSAIRYKKNPTKLMNNKIIQIFWAQVGQKSIVCSRQMGTLQL